MKTRGLHIFLTACVFMCAVSCHAPVNVLRNEMSFEQIKEEASMDGSGYCIVLVNNDYDIQYYKSKIIDKNEENPCLWDFVNVDRPENYWYKWALGTGKTPYTLVFTQSGILENIVFGVSDYAYESIIGTISSSDNDVPHINFGFNTNSVITLDDRLANEFVYNIMCLTRDTAGTSFEKYRKADSLSHVYRYPFNDYLRLRYGSEILDKDSQRSMATDFVRRYAEPYYSNIYSTLLKDVSESILREGKPEPVKIKTYVNSKKYSLADTATIVVSVTNTTRSNIEITKIVSSCDCMEMTGNDSSVIFPYETVNFVFSMMIEETGEINRDICFFTDISEMPIAIADFKIHVSQ